MGILIRSSGSGVWSEVQSKRYDNEAELQHLLADSPRLIPVSDVREGASELRVAIPEFPIGSGSADILAFSATGDIAIVECKLAQNPEIKRKVIGQILEYGAYLWGTTYGELDEGVQKQRSRNLADLVHDSVEEPEWDEEEFRSGIKESLEKGAFILVIAVDEINEELSRTIKFLNSCGSAAFSFHALEMRRFQAHSVEVLVPTLHGQSPVKPPTEVRRKKWTEEKFFTAIRDNLQAPVQQAIKDLYDWSREKADRVWFGTGAKVGSFTFHYLKDGKVVSVFTVSTTGGLSLNYGWLVSRVEREGLEEFHAAIGSILTFSHIPADFEKWPTVKIDQAFLNQLGALDQFKEAVMKLGARVHS